MVHKLSESDILKTFNAVRSVPSLVGRVMDAARTTSNPGPNDLVVVPVSPTDENRAELIEMGWDGSAPAFTFDIGEDSEPSPLEGYYWPITNSEPGFDFGTVEGFLRGRFGARVVALVGGDGVLLFGGDGGALLVLRAAAEMVLAEEMTRAANTMDAMSLLGRIPVLTYMPGDSYPLLRDLGIDDRCWMDRRDRALVAVADPAARVEVRVGNEWETLQGDIAVVGTVIQVRHHGKVFHEVRVTRPRYVAYQRRRSSEDLVVTDAELPFPGGLAAQIEPSK